MSVVQDPPPKAAAASSPAAATSFSSVTEMWRQRVRSTPDTEAMSFKVDGAWKKMTWAEADARVRTIAGGLLSLGLQAEQRVAILGGTSVSWVLADIGILCAGGHFTMDMARAAYAAKTFFDFNTVIPCHYRTFPLLEQSAEALVKALPGVDVIEPQVMEAIEL